MGLLSLKRTAKKIGQILTMRRMPIKELAKEAEG